MKQSESDIKNATKNVWGASPAGTTQAQGEKPGTRKFFEKVLKERFGKEHDFLPELVRYQDYRGKRVLEIGCGAGYDAYMFCKYGAEYTGIDIVPENIERTKKHLDLYGLEATILEMDAEQLVFDKKFDFIYSFGVLHHIPNVDVVLQRIKNHLRGDGEVWIAVYNKNSWFYYVYLYLFRWCYLRESTQYGSWDERVARIEFTTSQSNPYVKVYSSGELKDLFKSNGFKIIELKIRKLTVEDMPPVRFIWRFYKYISQSFLNVVARRWGWYLCIRAKRV